MGTVNSIITIENVMDTVYSFCIIALHASVSNAFMAIFCPGNKGTYLSLHEKCPILTKLGFS